MNKLKFWMSLGVAVCAIGSFVGCSGNGSATKPNDEVADSSEEKEPTWRNQYPIDLNEAEGSLVLHFKHGKDVCNISASSAEWVVKSEELPLGMRYKVEGGKLILWYEDDEDDKLIFSGNSRSIIGIWKSDKDDIIIKFTQDTFYTTELIQTGDVIRPEVESEIDLTSSYFMYDLYGCGTEGYNCVFSHWHFTKPAPDFILGKIDQKVIDIHEKTDRSASLTFAGKDFTINVENVQVDSLNNGNSYIVATIESQGNTCRFEHASLVTTKELCTVENVQYLINFAYEGEDEKMYSLRYTKDNGNSFADCVAELLK